MIHSRVYIEKYDFSEIVRISSEWREERKGYQDEHTTEVIACKHKNQYLKLKIYCLSKTMGGDTYEILEKTEITDKDHQEFASQYGGILDTQESRNAIEKFDQLNEQIGNVYPKCPKCSSKMTKRKGPRGPFLGCQKFPDCKGTRSYSSSYEQKFKELLEDKRRIENLINT